MRDPACADLSQLQHQRRGGTPVQIRLGLNSGEVVVRAIGAQRRQRTLEAVKELLLRESQVQPLLVVFEALLDSLMDSLPTARVLLLVNYRPEYEHAWGRKTYYFQLRIDPLPPESADALLHALLGEDRTLAPLRQMLIQRTEGNPFFLEESVRTLVETQVLVGERGAYRMAKAPEAWQIPATAQAILAARIDRLSPEDKRLLQAAAVIGKDVPFALLHALADVPIAPMIGAETAIICLQNGVDTTDIVARLYSRVHIVGGVVMINAEITAPGVIRHNALNRLTVGQLDGRTSGRLERFVALANGAGIETAASREGSSASNSDSKKLTKRPFPHAERGGGTRRSRRGGRLFQLAARTRKPGRRPRRSSDSGDPNPPCEASDGKASREDGGDALAQATIGAAACVFSLAVSLERRQCDE